MTSIPARPVADDNLDDKGRDINTGKTEGRRHPQGEIEQGGIRGGQSTSSKVVVDPHPSDEEHPYRERRPGGTVTPRDTTQRINRDTHDGKAPPRPHNVENDPA